VRAVDLTPPEQRRTGPGGPSRSGGAVYVLLGLLAVLVVVASAVAITNRQIADREAAAARVTAEAEAAERRAAALAPYEEFSRLAAERVRTVTQLADSRFDWAHTLAEISRLVPADVRLASLTGSVRPGVSVEGGASNPMRAALPNPAVELVGCADSHEGVARYITRLRAMDGVRRVSISESARASGGNASGGGGSAGGTDCRRTPESAQFNVVVFLAAPATAAPAGGANPAGGATPAPAGTPAPAPGGDAPAAEDGDAAQGSEPPAPATENVQ